jgi:hypothetical protein
LIAIGGQVLARLSEPKTVSRLWDEIKHARDPQLGFSPVSFDWFVLALSFLYGVKAIETSRGRIQRSVLK